MAQPTEIMLLGTYHFNNPGLDKFNMEADDVLSEQRQQELIALVDNLAKFAPDQIMFEVPVVDGDKFSEMYQDYLDADGVTENRNEHFQIGFRLARQLNHQQVYSIDALGDVNIDALVGYAMQNGQTDFPQKLQAFGESAMQQFAERQQTSTIPEMLHWFNQTETLHFAHSLYMEMLCVGNQENYIGADVVGDWYKRNFKIFNEIMRVADPAEKILVIYGQGHIPILQHCIDASPFATNISPLDYI